MHHTSHQFHCVCFTEARAWRPTSWNTIDTPMRACLPLLVSAASGCLARMPESSLKFLRNGRETNKKTGMRLLYSNVRSINHTDYFRKARDFKNLVWIVLVQVGQVMKLSFFLINTLHTRVTHKLTVYWLRLWASATVGCREALPRYRRVTRIWILGGIGLPFFVSVLRSSNSRSVKNSIPSEETDKTILAYLN